MRSRNLPTPAVGQFWRYRRNRILWEVTAVQNGEGGRLIVWMRETRIRVGRNGIFLRSLKGLTIMADRMGLDWTPAKRPKP